MFDALQTSFIFPGHHWQGAPETQVRPTAGEELVPLKARGHSRIQGLFAQAATPDPRPRPTILYFYGNAESIASARDVAAIFRNLGFHTMLVDYPGYGMSAGQPSEQGCYLAADAAFHHLRSRPDVDQHHLLAAGWSLGGAVAIELAHRHQAALCGLLVFSTFYSLLDFAQRQFPLLPVAYLLSHRFDSAEKLRHITLPTFIAHGRRDSLIPVSHAHRLAAIHPHPQSVTLHLCHQADHCDLFSAAGPPLQHAIAAFLTRITDL